MTTRKDWFILLSLFVLTFIPRLLLLSKGPFHYDVAEYLVSMRERTALFHTAGFPLVAFLLVFIAHARDLVCPRLGDLPIILFLTALCASLASLFLYETFKRLFGRTLALLYAALISFIPPFFSVSTFGRIDQSIAVMFMPVSIFFFFRKRLIWCALCLSLCIASRPESGILLCVYLAALFFERGCEKGAPFPRRFFSFFKEGSCLVVLSLVPVALIALVTPGCGRFFGMFTGVLTSHRESFNSEVFGGISLRRIGEGARLIFKMAWLPVALAGCGVLKKLLDRGFRETAFFLAGFLFFFVALVNMQVLAVRYFIFPLFFLFFFTSVALASLKRFVFIRNVVACLCVVTMLTPVFFIIYSRHLHAYQSDFARRVEKITGPGSLIITQDEKIFFTYYTRSQVLQPPLGRDKQEWTSFLDELKGAFAAGRPVYLMATGLSYDPFLIFRRLIQNEFYVRVVDAQINEDWYGRETDQHLFVEQVFRIIPEALVHTPKTESY